MSERYKVVEDMVLDFDAWLGKQNEEVRGGIQEHLDGVPEGERAMEKKRFTSMIAVSEATGIDPHVIREQWDTYRGGFAEKQGGDWLSVKDDDAGFFGQFQKVATKQRDERQMVYGPDDANAPDAEKLMGESLASRVAEAAYAGESYSGALSEWQDATRKRPGYDPARESIYADTAREAHSRMATAVSKVKPLAAQAYDLIAKARGVREGEGDASPFKLLRGLDPEEKNLAFRMMTDTAKGVTQDKGRWQAFGEAVGRSFENLALGGGTASYRSYLLGGGFREGDVVQAGSGPDEIKRRYTEIMIHRSGAHPPTFDYYAAKRERKLSAEDAKQWNEQLAAELEDVDTGEQLRVFGQQTVDSTKVGGKIFQEWILPAADSTALMASMAIPAAWAPAFEIGMQNYRGEQYLKNRALNMDPWEADRLAMVTGIGQAALDRLSFGVLKYGLPKTFVALERFAMTGRGASRLAFNFVSTLAAETAIEATQDHIIPALVQDNLASDPKFDLNWGGKDGVWMETWHALPATMKGMVLLSAMGGVAQTRSQSKFVEQFSSSAAAMRGRGYSLEQIAEIQAAPLEERGELLGKYLPTKAPTGAEREKLIADTVRLAQEEAATFAEKQAADLAATKDAADYAIRVTRRGDGWEVTKAGGEKIMVEKAEAARMIREDLRQAASEKEAEALMAVVDKFVLNPPADTRREVELTGEVVESDGQRITATRDLEVREMNNPAALAEIRREAPQTVDGKIDVIINGSNEEFAEQVGEAAKIMVQRIVLNRSESSVLTAVHEQVEGTWRRAIQSGAITLEETRRAIQSVVAAFKVAESRNAEEQAFRERVQRVADGTANQTEIRETVSELAVADVIGRRRDGSVMPAGSVTAAVDAMLMNATNAAEARILGKFRALLRAVRKWFRAVFGTVAALQKAKREGGAQDFTAMIDKLLGLDEQRAHEAAAAEEAEAIANEQELEYRPPTAEEEANGIAFSVTGRKYRPSPRGVMVDSLAAGDIVTFEGKQKTVARVSKTFVYESRGGSPFGRVAAIGERGLEYKRGVNAPTWIDYTDGTGQLYLGSEKIQRDGRLSTIRGQESANNQSGSTEAGSGALQTHEETPEGEIQFGDGVAVTARAIGGSTFSVSARKFLPGNYPSTLEKTIASTRVGKLTAHPRYDEAKREGSGEAALVVVQDTLKAAAVDDLKSVIAGRDVTFVPVTHRDTGRRANALPRAYAGELQDRLGGAVDQDIVKVSGAANTNATSETRFANEQTFDGPVKAGGLYVVVDDNHTSGDTLVALIDHIQAGGGEVVAATALAYSQAGNYLKPRPQDVAKLLDLTALSEDSFQREYGVSINALTGSEIYRLANLGPRGWDAARFREYVGSRVSPERSAQNRRGSSGGAGTAQGELGFSVSAGSRLELVSARLDAALAKNPAQRRELHRAANIKLQALAFNWETERQTGKGDTIRPLAEQRSAASLDREERVMEAFRREELEGEVYGRHASVFANENLAKIWGGPVMQALSKPGTHLSGRLKSKSAAMRSGAFDAMAGDFDGMDGVPRVVFGGDLMPDQAAQELYDHGILREPTTDALWNAIRQDVARSEQWKGFLAAANEELKQAKKQAHEEAAQWREEQAAMQKADWNPKAKMLRDMRTLDALLSVFPAEVRGKVGGFLKLAQLGSDKARLDEIGRRIEKLSDVVEKYLQKETTEAMDELVQKAQPSREAGQQSRGKLGVEAHRYFDAVAAAMSLSTAEVDAERAAIEAAYNDPALTDEQALDLFEREQILDAFGAWEKKSAADMDASFRAAQAVYNEGRNRWRTVEQARINEVKALAEEVTKTLGGPSYARSQAQKKKSKLKQISLDLKSFAEVLDAMLGANHPLAKRWTRAAQEAFAQKNDGVRAMNKRWADALVAATGKNLLEARRVLWDMGQKQTITADTEGTASSSTQNVPVDIIDAWARGEGDSTALGISPEEAAQLTAERAGMAPADRRQSLPLTRSSRGVGEVVKMTEAEAVFLTMLAGQEQYAEALDRAGWTEDAIEAIEKQLSPSAKNLRQFLREEYRQGYAPLASVFERMYGVELPQIKNYAPASFYHVGAERAMDPAASGTVEGNMRTGFLKNRKQHAAAPKLENAFATFFGHANQTEHWKALAEFVREFSSVIGKPDVKRAIEAAHGKEMLATVTQWAKALEGNGLQIQAGIADGAVNWLTSQQAKIKLAWKLGTILKQSTAVLGSAFKIPMRAYARGFGKLLAGQLEVREMFNSPLIQRRLETGFAPEIRDALNAVWNAKPTRRSWFVEKGMEIIGFADAFFTTGSAAIAFDYHVREAEKAGLQGEAAREAAMREVADIVNRTAQPADVVNRSLAELRMGAFGRLTFLFASEARQKSSLFLTAWGKTLTGKATAADYRVLAICHLILGPMIQSITNAWRDMRDDDDDEIFDAQNWSVMDYLKSVVAGPLSGIPLIGAALSGFRDDGIFGSAKKRNSAAVQLVSGPKEGEDEPVEWYVDRITTVMQGLDAFTGVSGSIINQGFHVLDNITPDSEAEANAKDKRQMNRERKEAREE